jgi:hypothetical protein
VSDKRTFAARRALEEWRKIGEQIAARKEHVHGATSLAAVRSQVQAVLADNTGTRSMQCPCCGQLVKKYARPLTSAMAYGLLVIYRDLQERLRACAEREDDADDVTSANTFIHVPDLLVKKVNGSSVAGGDVAKLVHWGLLEPAPAQGKKRRAGLYRITPLGIDFVTGKKLVPKYVYLYNSQFLGHGPELVDIYSALKQRFDYAEMMKGIK